MKISNLSTDWVDGVALCKLMELIANKPLRYHPSPFRRAQRLENAHIALTLLRSEHLRFVGIGPEDIVDGNRSLLTGLLWTIVLRFSVMCVFTDGDYPREELLSWVQQIIPQCNVQSFKQGWSDGLALCCLLDAVHPCGYDRWRSCHTPEERLALVAQVAEDDLDIYPAFDARDVLNSEPYPGVCYYVSLFRKFTENPPQKCKLP